MIEDVWFMGKKIGEDELQKLSACFGEKIDDMELCKAILAVAAQPGFELERGAFTRGLQHGYCGVSDGARAARALIRKMRRKLGYKYSPAESLARFWRYVTGGAWKK